METLIFEPGPSFVLLLHETWSQQWLLARSRHALGTLLARFSRRSGGQPADSGVRLAAASAAAAAKARTLKLARARTDLDTLVRTAGTLVTGLAFAIGARKDHSFGTLQITRPLVTCPKQ